MNKVTYITWKKDLVFLKTEKGGLKNEEICYFTIIVIIDLRNV